eukprot:752873-Pyramimonas_sp.AAC.1
MASTSLGHGPRCFPLHGRGRRRAGAPVARWLEDGALRDMAPPPRSSSSSFSALLLLARPRSSLLLARSS